MVPVSLHPGESLCGRMRDGVLHKTQQPEHVVARRGEAEVAAGEILFGVARPVHNGAVAEHHSHRRFRDDHRATPKCGEKVDGVPIKDELQAKACPVLQHLHVVVVAGGALESELLHDVAGEVLHGDGG